jgi:hypothetical protein
LEAPDIQPPGRIFTLPPTCTGLVRSPAWAIGLSKNDPLS